MKKEINKNLFAFLLSAFGSLFLIYYVFRASTDVVSSDYIRIVQTYLSGTKSSDFLLSMEAISRIPFSFLARYINVKLFHYSVYFDKILGISGLFLFNFVTVKYVLNILRNDVVKIIVSVIITMISFSLMSWEMILNGTGYPHLITVGFIALTFYLFDRIVKRTKNVMTLENLDSSDLEYYGNEKENNRLSNMVALIDTSETQRTNLRATAFVYLLVAATSLLIAGDYQVSFQATIIFFSIIEIFVFIAIRNKYNKGEIESLAWDEELYDDFKEQYNAQEIRGYGRLKGEKYSTVNNESTFKIIMKIIFLIIISLICFGYYYKSSKTGELLVPVGMKDVSLVEVLNTDVSFPGRFLLKSLASSIIGVETFTYAINFGTISENMIFLIGILYLIVIFITLIVFIIYIAIRKSTDENIFDINTYISVFPFMYIVIGLVNYILVFLARYKFLEDDYGMSSRYGIQYMFFTIGIILINAIFIDNVIYSKKYIIENKKNKKNDGKPSHPFIIVSVVSAAMIAILTFGHIITTTDEIFKADYRKIVYENLTDIARNYKNYSDEELMNAFEYHRSADHIKEALSTLEKNHLNIFRR